MKPTITALALCAALLAASGCTTALKEGAGAALGAKGSVTPLQSTVSENQDALSAYGRFELGRFTDGMNGKTPTNLLTLLPEAFRHELAEKGIPSEGSGKTILVRGKILHYEDSSTVGMALGPVEFVVARVEFVDKDQGRVVAVANCVGRTGTRVNLGVAKKAQGLARAIVKWIDKRFPKEKRLDD